MARQADFYLGFLCQGWRRTRLVGLGMGGTCTGRLICLGPPHSSRWDSEDEGGNLPLSSRSGIDIGSTKTARDLQSRRFTFADTNNHVICPFPCVAGWSEGGQTGRGSGRVVRTSTVPFSILDLAFWVDDGASSSGGSSLLWNRPILSVLRTVHYVVPKVV
jgi:hypothetical protein